MAAATCSWLGHLPGILSLFYIIQRHGLGLFTIWVFPTVFSRTCCLHSTSEMFLVKIECNKCPWLPLTFSLNSDWVFKNPPTTANCWGQACLISREYLIPLINLSRSVFLEVIISVLSWVGLRLWPLCSESFLEEIRDRKMCVWLKDVELSHFNKLITLMCHSHLPWHQFRFRWVDVGRGGRTLLEGETFSFVN